MKKLFVIGLSLLVILTWQESALADTEVQSSDKIQLDEKVKLIRSG
ncbi:MAG: hypothetical protein ABS942_12020 [Solibacillus sp.]